MISFDPQKILAQLISLQSFSKEETLVADYLSAVITQDFSIPVKRVKNNLYAVNKHFKEGQYTILLNSHIDTVKPNHGYTNNPFAPIVKNGKLYGLGSNDAGGALVGLLGAFIHLYHQELPYNLVFAATAEEEISGKEGMELLYPLLPKIDFAIVGEPTLLQIAIAERGLMVVDVEVHGKAGHAARKEGINAIYAALPIIEWFKTFKFPKTSPELGAVGIQVTQINSGTQHNVVPDLCSLVVDVRIPDCYTNTEVLQIIQNHLASCTVKARSTRLNSSGVSAQHPIRLVAQELNIPCYGSPTLSDQALISCESIKMGPGDSARSHTADEFIYLEELNQAIPTYLKVLNTLQLKLDKDHN